MGEMKMQKHFSLFNSINTVILAFVSLLTLLPFLIVISAAFSDETSIARNGYQLIPERWSIAAFKLLLGDSHVVFDAYKVTLTLTITGTILAVALTSMMAYALSRKNMKYRNVINKIVYIPMVFSGGLVPFYITLLRLHLKDNILGLIIPMVFSPFNLFLILNFLRGLPDSVIESAKIDGAGEFRIFRSIALYLALPGIATITLFYSLSFWNDWTLALLLINDTKLYPLQYLLRQILLRVTYVAQAGMQNYNTNLPSESTKMATVVVTIGPIIFVYPFIQKYFIKGITIGAVKG